MADRQNNRPSSGEEEDETSAADNVENEEIDSELSDSEARPDDTKTPASDSTVMWALIFLFIAVVLGIIYGIVRPEEDLVEEQFENAKDRLKEHLRT